MSKLKLTFKRIQLKNENFNGILYDFIFQYEFRKLRRSLIVGRKSIEFSFMEIEFLHKFLSHQRKKLSVAE